jgi:hypothetical protein
MPPGNGGAAAELQPPPSSAVAGGMPQILTRKESAARIRKLRAQGYQIKRINVGPYTVILKSKKKFVCSKAHCHRS